MAVIQISKIQLRRGLQQEISGDSLSAGEISFTTDTGRMFVGTDEATTGPWTGRSVHPFDNVEVLTENSTDTFGRLHDRMSRIIGPSGMGDSLTNRRPYLEAILAANTTAWSDVRVTTYNVNGQPQSATEAVILSLTKSASAVIEYTIFDGTNTVRNGTLKIVHAGNNSIDQALLTDDHATNFLSSAVGTPVVSSDLLLSGIRFRAMRIGANPNYSINLQYMNDTGSALRIQLRAMVAAKPEA